MTREPDRAPIEPPSLIEPVDLRQGRAGNPGDRCLRRHFQFYTLQEYEPLVYFFLRENPPSIVPKRQHVNQKGSKPPPLPAQSPKSDPVWENFQNWRPVQVGLRVNAPASTAHSRARCIYHRTAPKDSPLIAPPATPPTEDLRPRLPENKNSHSTARFVRNYRANPIGGSCPSL